jgi:hypothetical protein
MRSIFVILVCLGCALNLSAQQKVVTPDLSKIGDSKMWTPRNRTATFRDALILDAKDGDGLARLNEFVFENGIIDLDIKGKDEQGKSFVGVAFHGLNDSTYDAIYFRAFNFKNAERSNHSVQYISQPVFTWSKLRSEHPNQYENTVKPVPSPNDWFHATIVVDFPSVNVYVNNSTEPSLTVTQLSTRKKGWLALWVGNGSEGYFKNLKITSK